MQGVTPTLSWQLPVLISVLVSLSLVNARLLPRDTSGGSDQLISGSAVPRPTLGWEMAPAFYARKVWGTVTVPPNWKEVSRTQ